MHLIGSNFICQTVHNVLSLVTLSRNAGFKLCPFVPQGSVLGPKIYCVHTKSISDIIARHGLSHHSYADDTQLYKIKIKIWYFRSKRPIDRTCITVVQYIGGVHTNIYIYIYIYKDGNKLLLYK